MAIFDEAESARAVAIIANLIDGYEGTEVRDALAMLLTDVDDWESLTLELAGHCASSLVVLSKLVGVPPYELLERYFRSHT